MSLLQKIILVTIIFILTFVAGIFYAKKTMQPEVVEKTVVQEVVVEKEVEKIVKKEIIRNDGTVERTEEHFVERDKNTKKETDQIKQVKLQRNNTFLYGYRIVPDNRQEHIIQYQRRVFEHAFVGIQATSSSEIAILVGVEF